MGKPSIFKNKNNKEGIKNKVITKSKGFKNNFNKSQNKRFKGGDNSSNEYNTSGSFNTNGNFNKSGKSPNNKFRKNDDKRNSFGKNGRASGRFNAPKNIIIEPHRHKGVFIARGKEDALVTLNLVPGSQVYGEKRISIEVKEGEKQEYRIWNPFRSKLAAAILGGIDHIYIQPSSKVLYLGAASGTTVSHVSDIVGPTGLVYAVEFSHRSGRDLLDVCKKRTNILPIIEDARHPHKYRMIVGIVDCIFADVAQPDQARIVALNAQNFLKNGGHFVISIKASCIDSTAKPEAVFAAEVKKLKSFQLKPQEQITLEPYERDHAVVVGVYKPPAKKTKEK